MFWYQFLARQTLKYIIPTKTTTLKFSPKLITKLQINEQKEKESILKTDGRPLTNATEGESYIVEVKAIDPRLIRNITKQDTAHCIRNANNWQQIWGVLVRDA